MNAEALAALACPRCGGALVVAAGNELRCGACASVYPLFGEVPCLVPDPPLYRARWARRLDEYLNLAGARLQQINGERIEDGLLPRTRTRLIGIMRALEAERAVVQELLAPLAGEAPPVLPAAGRPQQPAVLKCYENLFRDWSWGDAEAARAREIVAGLVQGAGAPPLGRLAVFGAGAGRLAVDVHRTLGPACTLALDYNPLPLFVADRLVRGESLELYELPIGPHGADQVAVARRLSLGAAAAPPPGLMFVLGDGLRPPFAAGGLDTVLTPWFIDAVGVDLRVVVAALGRALRPGGLWLNFGPLRFTGPLSRLYTLEEVEEIVAAGGFEVTARLRETVPYFASPDSGSHRVETVFGFAAVKRADPEVAADAGQQPEGMSGPAWSADPRLPIPPLPELQAIRRTAVFTTGIISLIDGRRSIADLAAVLGQQWGADPAVLQDQLRAFLLDVLGESR